jgi:hypothetical protein
MIDLKFDKILVGLGATLATWGFTLVGEAKAQVLFTETMGPSLELFTPSKTTGLSSQVFEVQNFINNQSGQIWDGFDIDLQVRDSNGEFVPSGIGDGLSFNESVPENIWQAAVRVGLCASACNNTNDVMFQDPNSWDVSRENDPFDIVRFNFDTFTVSPGQTLYLRFDMSNTLPFVTWRLRQHVPGATTTTTPESSSILGMAILGAFGIASLLKRK